jgi:hypothetical protein
VLFFPTHSVHIAELRCENCGGFAFAETSSPRDCRRKRM